MDHFQRVSIPAQRQLDHEIELSNSLDGPGEAELIRYEREATASSFAVD
jgi:hypothetical protein